MKSLNVNLSINARGHYQNYSNLIKWKFKYIYFKKTFTCWVIKGYFTPNIFLIFKKKIFHTKYPLFPKKTHSRGSSIQFGNTESTHPLIHPYIIHPFSAFIHVLTARAEKARRCCCGRRGCCVRRVVVATAAEEEAAFCGAQIRSCAKNARENRDRFKLLLSKMGYKKSLQWSSTTHFFLRLHLLLLLLL